jgi:hypothetical protein
MKHKIVAVLLSIFIITGCASNRNEPLNIVSEVIERGSDYQNIQFAQYQVLFPYGVTATAEAINLDLLVSTSQKNSVDRMKDMQTAVDVITELVSKSEAITLMQITTNQVNGSNPREESTFSNIQQLDTSAITIQLAIKINDDSGFMDIVSIYNDFLNSISLPDTITIKASSIKPDLGDLEKYRHQIIATLYEELNSVKENHSQSVKFEITGLYDPLKTIQLSDVEFYLYLEPVVTVREF